MSLSSFSLSMNARGATVPLSPGLVEMFRNSERNAENRVGGAGGIGWGTEATPEGSAEDPNVEGRRSGLRLTGKIGVGGLLGVETNIGEGACCSGASKSCKSKSRNGVQKYKAWRTELA